MTGKTLYTPAPVAAFGHILLDRVAFPAPGDFQSIVIKDPGERSVTVEERFVGENARLVRVEGSWDRLVFVENRRTGDIVAVLELSGSNRRIMLIDVGEHVDTRVLKE